MHRILLLDDDARRAELVETIERMANAEAVVAEDEEELVTNVRFGRWTAVFADGTLLSAGASALMDAVRAAVFRPMLIVAADEKPADLDPDLVTLIVRKPYDVPMLAGILLAGVPQGPTTHTPPERYDVPR